MSSEPGFNLANTRRSHWWLQDGNQAKIEGLLDGTEHLNIFLFPPITRWCSISDVLFIGGRGVSDFSVLKLYQLNINYSVNIMSNCLHNTYSNQLQSALQNLL